MRKLLNQALKYAGYEIVRRSRLIDLMERRWRENPDFCFVQIGANDGLASTRCKASSPATTVVGSWSSRSETTSSD